jgi:hypothetical protein
VSEKPRDLSSFWAESRAQEAIVSFLRRALPSTYRIFAVPNGRFKADPRTIVRLKREGLLAGIPDLCIVRNDGWCAFLEVKAGKGKLSEEQNAFAEWWASEGTGCFAVVRGVGDVEAALLDWNVPLRARLAA